MKEPNTNPSRRPLTTKQKKFVREHVKDQLKDPTPPLHAAAMRVYDIDKTDPKKADDTARAIAAENLAKPSIREAVDAALKKHGITIEAAVAPIADGLTATRTVMTANGDIELKDHSIRLKASGMAMRFLGAENKDNSTGNTINFINNQNFNAGNYKK